MTRRIRHHVKVRTSGLHKGEQAGTIDTFASLKDTTQMLLALDYEIQCLQATAPTAIMEIDEANVVLFAIVDEVLTGEILGLLLQETHQWIGTHRNLGLTHNQYENVVWNK